MVNGKPLFTGVSENDQLKKIFKIRGTPTEKTYPDLKSLSEWNVIYYFIFYSLFMYLFFNINQPDMFEIYPEGDLKNFVPNLDKVGLDLLIVIFLFINIIF
jgi:hypothetical protein